MRLARAAAIAVIASVALPQAAGAVRGTIVPAERPVFGAGLTVAGDGSAVAAWARGHPVYFQTTGGVRSAARAEDTRIQVAVGSIDKGFGKPRTLAKTPHTYPALAGNRKGDAVVVWEERGRLRYSIRPRGGEFGAARVLADRGRIYTVAEGPGGQFVAAWASEDKPEPVGRNCNRPEANCDAPDERIYVATGTVQAGFGEPTEIAVADPRAFDVQMNRRGTVMLVHDEKSPRVWLRRPGRSLRRVGTVRGTAIGGYVTALRHDDSVAALVSANRGLVQTHRTPGGSFTAPELISRRAWFAELAVQPTGGSLAAAWDLANLCGCANGVAVADASPGRGFGPGTRLAGRGAWNADVVAAGEGRRLVTWRQNRADGSIPLVAAPWRRGQRPEPGRVVTRDYGEDAAGVADDGRGLAIWNRYTRGGEFGLFFASIEPGAR